MEDIKRICNLMVDLSKFTSNKKILNKNKVITYFVAKFYHFFIGILNQDYNFVWNQIMSFFLFYF